MSDYVKMSLKLFIITALAALALGITYAVTKEPIEQQKEQAGIEARRAVLSDAQQFVAVDIELYKNEYPGIVEVYEGRAGDTEVGYVFRILSKGYGGNIELYVGLNTSEGKVAGITIASHSETPGLGANAAEPEFLSRFYDKPIDKPLAVVTGDSGKADEVEAITGATITSKAVVDGVNDAISLYNQVLKDGGEAR